MNPEDHLVVRFLRFWGFNNAANVLVKSICSLHTKVSFHANVENAITELTNCSNALPLDTNSIVSRTAFFQNQVKLFKEIGEKYGFNSLRSEDILSESSQKSTNIMYQ